MHNPLMEKRLRAMGFNRPEERKPDDLARSLRKAYNGCFGKMDKSHREARGDFRARPQKELYETIPSGRDQKTADDSA